MMKQLITLLLALFMAAVAWPQETEEPGDTGAEATSASGTSKEEDDSELDEQGYESEDEDDFVPSEEVSADQSLPFPVDI
jgi:hypothetical protein